MLDQMATERSGIGRLPPVREPGFVGRRRELAVLADALAGPPAVVLVEGEAGAGKSRLIREYLAMPENKTRTALVATCPPFRQPLTLAPVTDALRPAVGHVGSLRLSALAGALRPLFPEWTADLPPAPEPAGDPSAARHRVFAALAELLGCLETRLLVAEDVHWADEATAEFLLYLAARQPRRVSLVVTYRPEDLPGGSLLPRLARLAAGTGGLRLALDALDVDASAALVSSMLAGKPVSGEFAAFVHERTGGLPLAVEESVRLMAARADLTLRGGEWVRRRRLAGIAVPPSIRDAVLGRAGQLSTDAQVLLRAAAVLAEPAGEQVLAAVAGMDAVPARAALSQALGGGLLGEDARGLMSFRHTLAAGAVYEAIPGPDRRAAHLRAGQVLADEAPPPVASLVRHFREGGDTELWLRYGEQAADVALAAGDEATAAMLLHDLITAAGLPPGTVARLAGKMVLLALPAESLLADLADALRATLASGGLVPVEEAELRFQLGRLLAAMNQVDASRAELERAVAGLAPGSLHAVRAMTLLGWPWGDRPAREHLRWLRRAADASACVSASERLRLLADRAGALLLLGEQAGWAEAARVPWQASEPGERLQVTRAHRNLAEAAMVWGRYGEARRRVEHAAELADRHHFTRLRDSALTTMAHLDWLTGAWDGLAEQTAGFAEEQDLEPMARLKAMLVTGFLAAAVGDRERAVPLLGDVIEDAHRLGAAEFLMEPAAALARLHLTTSDAAEALNVTDEPAAIVAVKSTWIRAADLAPARVAALIAAGRTGEAEALVNALAHGLRGRDAPAPKAGLAQCRAILAAARSDQARAAGLFARAAAAWQALPRPYGALLARERHARCLIEAGRAEAGLAVLTDVERGLTELGATGDADRVANLLREQGVTVPRIWRGGQHGYGGELSPREQDVVRLAAAGRTNRQIAAALYKSPHTVGHQLKSAMRKLGVSSRAGLAASAAVAAIIQDGGHPGGSTPGPSQAPGNL
jgi:DNA-binding CsgD family transcriptional regulator